MFHLLSSNWSSTGFDFLEHCHTHVLSSSFWWYKRSSSALFSHVTCDRGTERSAVLLLVIIWKFKVHWYRTGRGRRLIAKWWTLEIGQGKKSGGQKKDKDDAVLIRICTCSRDIVVKAGVYMGRSAGPRNHMVKLDFPLCCLTLNKLVKVYNMQLFVMCLCFQLSLDTINKAHTPQTLY